MSAATTVASAVAPSGPRGTPRDQLWTPWRLLSLLAGVAFVWSSLNPIRDVDVFWHVRVGREIVTTGSVSRAGQGWSFGLPEAEWLTTQWLSEMIFYAVHAASGWPGLAGLQVVVAACFALSLGRLLLWRGPGPWAALTYVLVLTVMTAFVQHRPQLFSMLLLVWVAAVSARLLRGGPAPTPWVVVAVTAVWANLHGLWVLLPACLLLISLGRLFERDGAAARRAAALAGVSLAGACLTPVGWKLLASPFRFAAATGHISEWQATTFDNHIGIGFGVLIAGCIAAWARSARSVPWSEVVYVVGLTGFALLAVRNVPVSAVLLAPVIAARLSETFPWGDAFDSRREASIGKAVALALCSTGLLSFAWHAATIELLPDTVPVELVQAISRLDGEPRVLNDYDVGGAILFWGGTSARVAIDGRADRYGAEFTQRHLDLLALRGDWQQTLARYDADVALLEKDMPLVDELRHRGWRVHGEDRHRVLLLRYSPA